MYESIAKTLNDSLRNATPVSDEVDIWDNMVDEGHPDFCTRADRLDHARLLVDDRIPGLNSTYAKEFETQGILPVRLPEHCAMMASFIMTLTDEDIMKVSD